MKINYSILPLEGIRKCAALMTAAQEKYPAPNWMTVNRAIHVQAALRHLFSWLSGEAMDREFGTSHLTNAAVRLLMAADVDKEKLKREPRYRVLCKAKDTDQSASVILLTPDRSAAGALVVACQDAYGPNGLIYWYEEVQS